MMLLDVWLVKYHRLRIPCPRFAMPFIWRTGPVNISPRCLSSRILLGTVAHHSAFVLTIDIVRLGVAKVGPRG